MQTLVDLLSLRMRAVMARMAVSASFVALIGLMVVTAWFGLVAALAILVAERLGPVYAALSVSAITIVAALVLVMISRWRRQRELRRRRPALVAASVAPVLVPLLVRRGPIFAFAAAALVAYLVTRSADKDD